MPTQRVETISTLDNVVAGGPAPAGHHGQHPAEHHLLDPVVEAGAGEVDRRQQHHPGHVAGNADEVAEQNPYCPV